MTGLGFAASGPVRTAYRPCPANSARMNGVLYYRTRIKDANGKLIALYARTPEELYDREIEALEQIDNATFHRKSPTVAEYCEKWLLMQSVHIRATTLTDYTSKGRRRSSRGKTGVDRRTGGTPFRHYPGFTALCVCYDRFVCRIAAGRNPCIAMGFCIFGYGYPISDGKAGMAHRA